MAEWHASFSNIRKQKRGLEIDLSKLLIVFQDSVNMYVVWFFLGFHSLKTL